MLDQVLIVSGITILIMLSPGPDMAIVTRNTILGGKGAGLTTSLGVLTGNLVHIGYCVVGIGMLISRSIVAFSVLRYAGAAYLVYLGVSSLLAGRNPETAVARKRAVRRHGWYVQGFINNILNPKGTLFYLGVFTMVITPDTGAGVTVLLILIMVSISSLFWLAFVMTLDHPAVRRLLDRSQVAVNRIFGVLLVSIGLRVALIDS